MSNRRTMGMADRSAAGPLSQQALLLLMNWLSPAFPVGGFSYSHGLEKAVDVGALRTADDVSRWIARILGHGGGRIDAVLFLEAHRAVLAGDHGRLADARQLADAWRGTAETALEARAQGRAFIATVKAGWPSAALAPWLDDLDTASYAIAVGAATAAEGIGETLALTAFLQAFAANLVSAAVRLVPLGQTDGQKVLRALAGLIPTLVAEQAATPLDDLGTASPMVDWTSMSHETQYTRLFRS